MKGLNEFIIGFVYLPPEGSPHAYNNDLFHELESDIAKYTSEGPMLLMGDFNAHTAEETDYCRNFEGRSSPYEVGDIGIEVANLIPHRHSRDNHPVNAYGRRLLDVCISTDMFILNGRSKEDPEGEFTRVENGHKSTIDYCLCSVSAFRYVDTFVIGKLSPDSDHRPINVTLNCSAEETTPSTEEMCFDPCSKYSLPEHNIDIFIKCLEDTIETTMAQIYLDMGGESDVNIIINGLQNMLAEVAEKSCIKHTKRKNVKRNLPRPWVDDECQELRRQVSNAKDLDTADQLCKEYKKLTKSKKAAYKRHQMEEIQYLNEHNKNEFWRKFKQISEKKVVKDIDPVQTFSKLTPMSKTPHEDYFDKNHLKEVENFLDQYDNGSITLQVNEMSDILNAKVTQAEVTHAINKLKKKKSPGLDGLPAEMIIYGKNIIAPHLMHIFNFIIDKEQYPKQWAEGLRVAIPKDKNGDVRPITITNILGKLMEMIIDNRMAFIDEIFSTNDKFNGGFSKGSSTSDNMLILLGLIQKQLSQGKRLYVAFIDFRKAFNYVNHNLLFWKLIKSGLHGKVINLLRSLYNQTKARVKINGLLYDWIFDEVGVNQGGPNSPRLFNKFLSDLSQFLSSLYGINIADNLILLHLLWADDLLIVSDTEEGLQSQIDGVHKFCSQSHMIVNELKTKIMIFGYCNDVPTFIYNGKVLDVVDNYKYLGVVFNSVKRMGCDPFRHNYKHVDSQASKAIFSLTKSMCNVGKAHPSVALHLFDSLVRPILEYSSEIWYNNKDNVILERVQLKYIKMMLGVANNTSNLATYGETGRFPLFLRQKIKVLKYWHRVVSKPKDSLVYIVYQLLVDLHNSGFKSWASEIYELLNVVCPVAWENQRFVNMNEINQIYTVLCDNYIDMWRRGINDVIQNPKLRLYCTFKSEFQIEPYLVNIKEFKLRKVLSRFRLSNHELNIEKGRYHKIPKESRYCEVCSKNEFVEDECHFLLYCPSYNDVRQEFFKIYECQGELALDFQSIVSNDKNSFYLAKLLIKMFKIRKTVLALK